MDQSKKPKTCSASSSSSSSSSGHNLNLRQEKMVEVKEEPVSSSSCRKILRADREKIRRDKLNQQFLELGNTLDPNRPKSDKTSILNDTIQILKDLMTQVDKLKAEFVTLSQEANELMQEKSALRVEKSSLNSDIEILNAQYQDKVRKTMVPWIPQYYTFPLPVVAMTQVPISITEQASIHHASSSSVASYKQDSKSKSLDLNLMRNSNLLDHKDDVGLELELKIHASSSSVQQDASRKEKKGGSSSNSYSSSQAVQDSSFGNINNISKS